MRPDEQANRSEIDRDQQFRSNVVRGVKAAATVGSGAATARILPFLSEFIPADLAMKGLSKVSPKVADFLKRGQSMGLNVEEGIQYIRDSITPKETEQPEKKNPKDNRNIIEQYSPELHQFISQQVSGGRKPIEAAALAQNDKRFSAVIKKLSKDHNSPWSSIIDSIYGTGQYGGAVNPISKNQPQQPTQQGAQQSGQPTQQAGQGQQALMAILDKINQRLGQ